MSSIRIRLAALAMATGIAVAGAVVAGAGTASAAGPAPQLVTKSPGFTTSVGGLRIRSGPSTGYAAYGLLYRGDRFALLGSANHGHGTWHHIRLTRRSASGLRSGHTGWVSAAYVRTA